MADKMGRWPIRVIGKPCSSSGPGFELGCELGFGTCFGVGWCSVPATLDVNFI
jgi:hypothetical protein